MWIFAIQQNQTDVLATSSSAIILALGVKPGAAGESSPGDGLYEGIKWGRHRRRGG